MDIVPAVNVLLQESDAAGQAATHLATAPVLDYQQFVEFGLIGRDAVAFNQSVLDHILHLRIPNVILAANWSSYFEAEISDDPDAASAIERKEDVFSKALLATVARLRAAGVRVWVFEEVPHQQVDVPSALAYGVMFGRHWIPTASRESHSRATMAMQGLSTDLEAA